MNPTVQKIFQAVLPFDGQKFESYEALENVILPIFGPLQEALPGQSFRDLIDSLIASRWLIDNHNGTYEMKLPQSKTARKALNPEEPKQNPSESEIEKWKALRDDLTLLRNECLGAKDPGTMDPDGAIILSHAIRWLWFKIEG